MMHARLAALASVATMVLSGAVHAAGPAPISPAPSQPVVVTTAVQPVSTLELPAAAAAVAVPALREGSVQLALNTFDAQRPAARSAAMEAKGTPENAAPSYLVSATQYMQDVGTFWSGPAPEHKEVPLPGALWLFGSALLAFLAISVRRKF